MDYQIIQINLENLQLLNLQKYADLLGEFGNKPCNITHQMIKNVLENTDKEVFIIGSLENPLGTISIIYDKKLFHNCKMAVHIEDLIVSSSNRNCGLGKKLILFCIQHCKQKNCYKIILNCDTKLIDFYNKLGFKENQVQMRMDF